MSRYPQASVRSPESAPHWYSRGQSIPCLTKSIPENIRQARQRHIFTIENAMPGCLGGKTIASVYKRPDVVVLGGAQVSIHEWNLRPRVKGSLVAEEALHP